MDTFLVLFGLHVVQDGIPQSVSTAPLCTGTAVQALFCACFLPPRRFLFCGVMRQG